ncbi:glutaredoxin [Desulfobacterota bacterium AH_259_B03_O07]|nr:glutaredoxin [Desulfobacterota bacterium AH_259_B03_O07]
MQDTKVEVYTTTYCPFCRAAKALLDSKGVKYEEIDVTYDPHMKRRLMEKMGWKTVPIIMIDDELIGGYEELRSLEIEKKLDEILNLK